MLVIFSILCVDEKERKKHLHTGRKRKEREKFSDYKRFILYQTRGDLKDKERKKLSRIERSTRTEVKMLSVQNSRKKD